MKRWMIVLWLAVLVNSVQAQGLVNFYNNSATLVSAPGGTIPPLPNAFYFGLLTAPVGTTDPLQFTFTGVYATNQMVAGRFTGGAVPVSGWAVGQTRSFLVAGWPSSLGHDYNPLWLQAWHGGPPWFPDVFGISGIGTGAPGGFDGFENRPNLNIFGAAPSISMGFTMVLIPEPTSVGLGALGLAMFLWRRVGKARANTDYI